MPTRYLSPKQIADQKRKKNIFFRFFELFKFQRRQKLPSSVADIVEKELRPSEVAARKITKRSAFFIVTIIVLLISMILITLSGIPAVVINNIQSMITPRGELVVTTEFFPAEVILNGVSLGSTPLTVNTVQAGDGTLLLKAKSNPDNYFTDLSIPIVISSAATTVVTAQIGPSLESSSYTIVYSRPENHAQTESLIITSVPAGVTVFIDSEEAGKTPFSLVDLAEGKHTVSLRSNGFREINIDIQKQSGRTIVISSKLYQFITKDGGL